VHIYNFRFHIYHEEEYLLIPKFYDFYKNKLSSEADLLYIMRKAAKRVNETLWFMVDQQLATSVQGYRTSQPCVSGYGIHSITAQPLSTK
jgi:hypothetical protein